MPTCTAVLLPGLDGTGKLFDDFIRSLPSSVQTQVISYPTASVMGYAELTDYVAGRAPAAPYVVVAESFSGPVALSFGARRPAGLRGIVLCSSFLASPVPRWLRILPFGVMFRLGIPKAVLRYFLVGNRDERVVRNLAAAIGSVPSSVLAARVQSVLACNAVDALEACSVPVLFIFGSADRLVRRCPAQPAPDMAAVNLDGPHLLLQTRPHDAAQVIASYVQRWCAS